MRRAIVWIVGFPLSAAAALAQGITQGGRALSATPGARPVPTLRVSVDSSGGQADNYSFGGAPSADARYIAFGSLASNLVPGDSNSASDVFVHDRVSGLVTLVSVDSSGIQGDGESYSYDDCISADGRFVLFGSAASNLVPGDTNGARDVFVRDLVLGLTTRVDLDAQGQPAAGTCWPGCISADGTVVAFLSSINGLVPGDANGVEDVFVRDLVAGTTERVSVSSAGAGGNAVSQSPSLSADGRLVAFGSWATNLVAGDVNAAPDVFQRDRQSGTTMLVSTALSGAQGTLASSAPCITPDGRFVAFGSYATDLVPGDVNGESDVFVKDMNTGAVVLVSVSTSGAQGNGGSLAPSLSADGRFVGFQSAADNLSAGDTNLCSDGFVRDLLTGGTWRVTVGELQLLGNDFSGRASLSADGRFVAFESHATNLVSGDTNLVPDVFVRRNVP